VSLALPRSQQPLVSILIVVLERSDRLRACFEALARNLPRDIPVEIVVVLCRFDADVAADLRAWLPGITFFSSDANLGMAGGMNMARSLASGTYLVALHDDAEIEPGWLEALVTAAGRNPFAGAVGSMAIRQDGLVQYAGAVLWNDGHTATTWAGRPQPLPADVREARPVDYCGTSSLLVRADAFDAARGCDEAFYPAYYVDVNIALGLRAVGRHVMVEPASKVLHYGGGSSTLRYRRFMSGRNRVRFQKKWAADLSQFEPPPPAGNMVAASVDAALARAAAFADRCRRAARPLAGGGSKPIDVAEHQRRHFAMEDALRRDYVAMLEQKLRRSSKRLRELEGKLRDAGP
jgi:GT2 family glycosyltransferase